MRNVAIGVRQDNGGQQLLLRGLSTPGQGKGAGPAGDKWSQTTQETVGGAEVKRSGTESSQKQAAAAATYCIIGDAERSVCSALLLCRFLGFALRASLEMT